MKDLISCEKVRTRNIDQGALMKLNKILKNTFFVIFACLVLSACATSKKSTGQMQGDVYTGTDTVEYLASGVPDRVFFATNESVLTTASRETLEETSCMVKKKF